MIRTMAVAGALLLSGCVSIVQVTAEGGKPTVGGYPFGVRIERGSADAIAVRGVAIGASQTCIGLTLGVASGRCIIIDAASCGVAIFEPAGPAPPPAALVEISKQTRAICLHQPKDTK